MNLFTISDLHLPFGVDKPMNIFGGWNNYVERIENNWKKLVNSNDTVVIGGDISWASSLGEAKPDFEFINKLPGTKIILKGNHDYWWSTANKINEFLKDNKDYSRVITDIIQSKISKNHPLYNNLNIDKNTNYYIGDKFINIYFNPYRQSGYNTQYEFKIPYDAFENKIEAFNNFFFSYC